MDLLLRSAPAMRVLCPQFIMVFTAIEYSGIVYHGYRYPWWGEGIGWSFVVTAIGMIPLWAFIRVWKHVGGSCGVSHVGSSCGVSHVGGSCGVSHVGGACGVSHVMRSFCDAVSALEKRACFPRRQRNAEPTFF